MSTACDRRGFEGWRGARGSHWQPELQPEYSQPREHTGFPSHSPHIIIVSKRGKSFCFSKFFVLRNLALKVQKNVWKIKSSRLKVLLHLKLGFLGVKVELRAEYWSACVRQGFSPRDHTHKHTRTLRLLRTQAFCQVVLMDISVKIFQRIEIRNSVWPSCSPGRA